MNTPRRTQPANLLDALDTGLPPIAQGDWEAELVSLLSELSQTQGLLLAHLGEKQRRIAAGDERGLVEGQPEEQRLIDRLAECQRRRRRLLSSAREAGLAVRDLRTLAERMPRDARDRLRPTIRDARRRQRLLQHKSLANWVVVQRTLLHLSQMIEIVATGGQKAPTYGDTARATPGGGLVDRAA